MPTFKWFFSIVFLAFGTAACASEHLPHEEKLPVTAAGRAQPTADEIRHALDQKLPELQAMFPNLQGTHVDRAENAAVLTVYAEPAEDARVLAKREKAEAMLHAPVRIHLIRTSLKQQN